MRHLNYNHLLYFWSVARSGSVAAAATQNFITPQTISGQLRQLEEALGQPLFHRTGRRLELTEFGHAVSDYCDDIFGRGAELASFVQSQSGAALVSLRAGIVDSIPKLIAERLLGGALEHEQGVRLKCREGPYEQLLADLAVHRLDVVLADQPVPSGLSLSVYGHRLGRSPLCFMARSELARKLRRRFPQSLNAAPMLLPAPTSALRGRIDRWLDDHDVQPLVVGEFDDSALMKAFGQAGTGVIVAPAAIEAEVRRMYRLVAIGTADTVFEDYFAVTPYKDIRHVAVERLCRNAPTRLAASES